MNVDALVHQPGPRRNVAEIRQRAQVVTGRIRRQDL